MNQTADAIIIGGGIHGASLAFHLARRGLRPLVIERRFIAAEATGRSSGLVRMHYDLEPESRLAWESFQYFTNWAERVGGECGFVRTGFLQIVPREIADKLQANVAMHQRIGIPALVVTAEDVQRLAPHFAVDDFDVAAYEPESGYADPSATTVAMMDAARREGAALMQDCTVTAIQVSGGKVSGVSTTKGDVDAPIVVNAAGARAAEVGQMAGLALPVDTWRHDTMFINRPPELGRSHPTVIDDANLMYFRPETGGLTLIGMEDTNEFGGSPDGYVESARPGFVEKAIDRICRRFPAMEGGSVHSSHGGYDGITPDQRAILGPSPVEGFWLQCGFSGTGFKIGPAVGACMAEWMLDGAPQTVDVTMFSVDRFEAGERLAGAHDYGKQWS